MKWEYYGIRLDTPDLPWKTLRLFGDEGWEAVGQVKSFLLLKRPREEASAIKDSTNEEKCLWIRQLAEEGTITAEKAAALEERYGAKIL